MVMESNAPKINVDDFFRLDQLKPKQEEPETLVKNKPQDEASSKDESEEFEETDDDQDDGDYVEEEEQSSFESDDEDDDEEDEDEDPSKIAAKAEKKRRGFQSENAKLKAKNDELNKRFQQQQLQINMLMAQLSNPNVSQNQSQAAPDRIDELEELLQGDPDDYPTNATIKKILSGMKGRVRNKSAPGADMTPQKLAWMVGQPDYQEINEYANKFNLQTDPYFSGAATDEVGAFFGIRSKILQGKVNKLESQIKKMSKTNKKRKGKVPVTGSRGPANKGQANNKKRDFWTSLKFN